MGSETDKETIAVDDQYMWAYDIETDSFTDGIQSITSAELSVMNPLEIDRKYPGLRQTAFILYAGTRIDEALNESH